MTAAQTAPSRAEINSKNSLRSTGPRSAAGKQKVRFNALKHGMRAKTVVLPDEDLAAFGARHDAWMIDLAPRDEVDRFLVTRAVEISWRLDRIRRAMESRRSALRHADTDRLAAEAEEVVALGRRLNFDTVGPVCLYPHAAPPAGGEVQRVSYCGIADDPDDPARIMVRMEALTLGCAWLLDRWGELREILECGLSWQPHDRLKAVRMFGRQPLDAPDDRRVMIVYLCGWAMDPNDQYGFSDMVNEMRPGERKVFIERLNSREAATAAQADEEAARATLLALIAEEEERLDAILAGHLEREEAEAQAALAFDASPEGERLRRYEAENDRALLRVLETLRKRHREADSIAPRVAPVSDRAEPDPIEPAAHPPADSAIDRAQDDSLSVVPASTDASQTEPSNEQGPENRLDPPSRNASSFGLLAGADLALFALLVFAGRFAASATISSIGARSPWTVSSDAPAHVCWVRSCNPQCCEAERNPLRQKGNASDRPGGRGSALRLARPA